MLHAYKYRLYPTRSQEEALQKSFGCARWSYNWALETRVRHYIESGKTLSASELNKRITTIKKEKDWLNDVSDWVLKEAVANCCAAFQRFFEGTASFPRFKAKHKSKKTATFRRMPVEGNRIKLAKIGNVKFVKHREFDGEVKRIIVSQNASESYYVTFLVEEDTTKKLRSSSPVKGVGVSASDTHFCALSTSEIVERPTHFDKAQKKLEREQKRLARKKSGSARYRKQKIKVAKAYERVLNKEKDFQHKLSRRLVNENQVIAVEYLCAEKTLSSCGSSRSAQDLNWSQFVSFLEYKCDWYGVDFLKCEQFEMSAKICSRCGCVKPQKSAKITSWQCCNCGTKHNKEVNTALNILKIAVAGTANGRGGDIRRANMQRYNAVLQFANSYEASSL